MHVNDLLRLDGASFVEAAYSTILKRQADRNGLDHFIDRLESGDKKEAILVALATSREARGSRIDLAGLSTAIKKHGKSPWRRFLRFFSELRNIPRQLTRIEHMLREQGQSLSGAVAPYPTQLADSSHVAADSNHVPKPAMAGNDLNRTLVSLQENLSNTAHDADLLIDNFKKTIRSSPSFFAVGQ
jgi:hypothetical protein